MQKNKVFKNFIINALGILFSRVLGLVRDVLLALFLGAGLYSDIFFVAIKMPAFFRRIFAEGAFGQSFLPNFTSAKKKGAFTLAVLVQFCAIVFLFCLLVSFFAEFFTKIFAFGFNAQTIAMAAPLVAINFWYLFFIFLVTLLGAILNYEQKFFITSFSSSFFNLCIVLAAFFVDANEPEKNLYYFSYAIVLSGLAQLIWHIIALRNNAVIKAMFLSIKLKKTKVRLKKFYSTFFHGILGSSATQLSTLLDTTIASFLLTGSISYLYYANRVFQLPLALFAIALTQVSFPKILKHLKSGEEKLALSFMQKALEALSFLLILATIIGIIFAHEITALLFERGNFSDKDTKLTALVLISYMLGLLPFGLQKLLSLWLYAKFKQKIAAIIAFKALLISLIFSLACVFLIENAEYKVIGVSLASSVSAFYLLGANIKEFGFARFFSLIRLKHFLIACVLLLAFALLLLEFKAIMIQCLVYTYEFFKGLI
ncbi:murein biosynthesis integral membrane protein MurJ [Campylobacter sp. MIT 12-8780]|uniref:murein biosynthesis integral membrane protein MurJ n=1 Tax=unclassified Campylobacter TaxID=2593542 RepID=UPI00115C8A11|nr:murein biosynthesis integral membrane protein MurJ [Campylobacter sp. MIT 12-8780]NDJ27528.1 murein biosynthesis integral membrane protein MurJ [Campylobacter sp. MIT 19-121]TQR41284.1 murein biosynthesis integral membrane protein MurJ [Campylobacter sp. MIT 12-8780]